MFIAPFYDIIQNSAFIIMKGFEFLIQKRDMSEKELDAILNEIKKHSSDDTQQSEPAVSNEPQTEENGSNDAEFKLSGEPETVETEDSDNGTLSLDEKEDDKMQDNNSDANEYFDLTSADVLDDDKKPNGSKKKIIIAVVAVIVAVAVGIGVYFGFFHNKKTEEPQTTQAPQTTQSTTAQAVSDGIINPLTGEDGYNQAAVGKRPVAVVVENEYSTTAVRPQWGLSDADIVLEGESEFSTRLLLFWADYTKMPNQIGPARSARPPFIHFSQLFDSVFIHAGLSHSKGSYLGADDVFKNEGIDHINLLSEGSDYFSRDKSRTKTIEHTGFLKGNNVPALLESKKIDTKLDDSKFTQLSFNQEVKPLGDTKADSVSFKWTSSSDGGRCPKTGKFTYSDGYYTTTDFDSKYGEAGCKWQNLIFLLDKTEYVVKQNYKGSGKSETYCDYKLSGGKGMVLSQGTAVEITWGVSNGKLWMKDANGNDVSLNPGKTYIGYGSSNYGGSISLNK